MHRILRRTTTLHSFSSPLLHNLHAPSSARPCQFRVRQTPLVHATLIATLHLPTSTLHSVIMTTSRQTQIGAYFKSTLAPKIAPDTANARDTEAADTPMVDAPPISDAPTQSQSEQEGERRDTSDVEAPKSPGKSSTKRRKPQKRARRIVSDSDGGSSDTSERSASISGAAAQASPTSPTSPATRKSKKKKADLTDKAPQSEAGILADNGSVDDKDDTSDIEMDAGHALAERLDKQAAVTTVLVSSDEHTATRDVLYGDLCATFDDIEKTTKRLEILSILTAFLHQVMQQAPDHLIQTIYLCINQLGPQYEGLELGIGESLLLKAIAKSGGRDLNHIKAAFASKGDLGTVAQECRTTQQTLFKPKKAERLSVSQVFTALRKIASISGQSSMNRKVQEINGLLVKCQGNEAKFLIRSLAGKLRIRLAEKTVLVALAHAAVQHRLDKEQRKLPEAELSLELARAARKVKAIYNQIPSYDKIVPILIADGVDALEKDCKLTPGIPINPMLAHPTKSITEVLDRFDNCEFTCEYKYDGERAQVHFFDNELRVYSRNSENMSQRYPDIAQKMQKAAKSGIRNFILDCEAVAWDREKHEILPFQVLSTRKRKDVREEDIKVQVRIFAFDVLYLNDESLLQVPLAKRRELLYSAFVEVPDEFGFARYMNGCTADEIQVFLDESIRDNCEGLMVKTLAGEESTYEPSIRSRNWLKIKKDYLAGVGDTLDLIVLGGYLGKGKRTDVYGGYLLGCYNDKSDTVEAICKIGTGFSDEDLKRQYAELQAYRMSTRPNYYNIGGAEEPDHWFSADQVWEVMAADLSISPRYTAAAGQVDRTRGISLRFPRYIRLREDKSYQQATSSEQVADMYRQQFANNSGPAAAGADSDSEGDMLY